MSGVDNAPPEGRLAGPRYLSGTEAAARVGVRPATWRAYVARGQAPAADAWVGDGPGWLPASRGRRA